MVCEVHQDFDWRGPVPASSDQIATRSWCVLDPADRALPESIGSNDPQALETVRRVREGVRQNSDG
eukprot:6921270-Alexandrium_andersonii.AAC.1